MLTDDNLLCCLLPNKCNLYNSTVFVQIFSTTFYILNFLVVIYTLATTLYSFWLVWKEYIKKILCSLLNQDSNPMDCAACDVNDILNEFINTFKCNEKENNCDDNSQYSNQDNNNQCKLIVDPKSLKCTKKNNTKSQSKTWNYMEFIETNENTTKVCTDNKGKNSNITTTLKNKNKRLIVDTSSSSIKDFCVSHPRNCKSISGDRSRISNNSCWPLINKVYN